MNWLSRLSGLYTLFASLPTLDRPPANIALMIQQCAAKGRTDLGDKIHAQWAKVLEKYPATRLNFGAATSIGSASIKKNVFKGMEFVEWLSKELNEKLNIAPIPTDVIPEGVPTVAIPKPGETPEDWKAAAKETEAMLTQAHAAFKTTSEFIAHLEKEIVDLQRKLAEYGPGGSKHLLKDGRPHSYVQRIPKWEGQIKAYGQKLAEVKADVVASNQKFESAAADYHITPITTVEFEHQAHEALADVLAFILDVKDLKKQKELLAKFQTNLKKMEEPQKVAASEGILEYMWDKVVEFWEGILDWARGLVNSVNKFDTLVHIEDKYPGLR